MTERTGNTSAADKCAAQIEDFVSIAADSVARTSDAVKEVFTDHSMRMNEGVVFRTTPELRRAAFGMASCLVETLGTHRMSISEAVDLSYSALAELVKQEPEPTGKELIREFRSQLLHRLTVTYDIVAPCNHFLFESEQVELRHEIVSVVDSSTFVEHSDAPKKRNDWKLAASDGPWPDDFIRDRVTIYGKVWWIKSQSSKNMTPQTGRWLAEIFLSTVRLGIQPADYCHRCHIPYDYMAVS